MDIDKWVSGYKVRAFDWIDGQNIYLHIEHFLPGSSLSRPPAREQSFLIPKEHEYLLYERLDSVVCGLMARPFSTSQLSNRPA